MCVFIRSRYINSFTDFGFKKLFGEEANIEMFIKAFGIAEITHLDKEKRLEYEASLKSYRDLSVVLNESFNKGKIEGKTEEKKQAL